MYLKEISTTGFKSFADQIQISLDDKITCIVGPNGSGKSNIVDAVRWVLGEQSIKSLRGDGTMSDVIFGGSKSRKPLNVASVSLVFDNRDHYLNVPYTEVSVKRRVYRSGENEYFLNGERCRLKDITDLFMDSGIGKESFNIISQGEVMRILSTSSHDRRVIFEEAAGVLKYKKRKEEAFRKLDRTHDNLDRVSDIIHELEQQVEPLREQSKKAQEYLSNKEGLDKYEVALLTYDITDLNNQYERMKTRIGHLEEEILSLSSFHVQKDANLANDKNELLKIEKELSDLNQQLLNVTEEAEKKKNELTLLQERSKYDASSSKVQEQLRTLTLEKKQLEMDVHLAEQEVTLLEGKVQDVSSSVLALQKEMDQLSKEKNQKELSYQNSNRRILALEQQIQLKKNLIEEGGSLPQSVKSVLGNDHLKGIHHCLGNLVEVEPKYTKALEVSLASSKFFLVCDHEDDAKQAISYLKENRLGRATFFPISVIKPRFIDSEMKELLQRDSSFVAPLSDLLTFRSIYQNIMLNQFGTVLVATDLDGANRLSKLCHGRYKIVTLDGDVVHIGGSLTGGTLAISSSIVSEKLALKQLESDVVEEKSICSSFTGSLEEIQKRFETLQERLLNLMKEKSSLASSLELKKGQVSKEQERLDSMTREYDSLSSLMTSSLEQEEKRVIDSYYEMEKEKEEITLKRKAFMERQTKLKNDILEHEAEEKNQNVELHKKEQELKTLEIECSKIDVKLDHLLQELSEEYSLTYEKAKKEHELDIEVDEARQKVSIYRENIKRIGMVNLASIEEFERVNTRYEYLLGQRDDLYGAKDTLLHIIEEMDQVMTNEFSKTFELVRSEFQQVFKELFNGGFADLKMTDPDHVLETGVEIVASPPGKKLSTISLLSGGEKTLTAISLLFAILNIRTVPFCLFDEVEAALDEANVDQFGKYLDHYKNKTQFLIITHKKKTMEYADTLYGITMQESGVSKLVSVRFDEEVK